MMTAEEKIFGCRRFLFDKLKDRGFEKTIDGFIYKTDFMGGDFSAHITVSRDGKVSAKVYDNMNGEEYLPFSHENFQGAYVSSVRAAYEDLLTDIAKDCCYEVYFASDQANRITELVREKYGVLPDFPFEGDRAGVFRHKDTAKWFGLVMGLRMKTVLKNDDETPTDVLNLKAREEDVPRLIKTPGIYKAYHMNHRMWISVVLNGTLDDAAVMKLIDDSFELTDVKNKKRK